MRTLAIACAALALSACGQASPPPAKAPKSVAEVLWPKPIPLPPVKPAAEAPKAKAAPAARAEKPARPATPRREKNKRVQRHANASAMKPTEDNSGPDLPWPCALVRMHAAGKTRAQLEAEGRAHGISLSPKQRRQAAACLR